MFIHGVKPVSSRSPSSYFVSKLVALNDLSKRGARGHTSELPLLVMHIKHALAHALGEPSASTLGQLDVTDSVGVDRVEVLEGLLLLLLLREDLHAVCILRGVDQRSVVRLRHNLHASISLFAAVRMACLASMSY